MLMSKTMEHGSDSSATPEKLAREARAWVIRLTSGDVAENEASAFSQWQAQSPMHERAFAEATHMRSALSQICRLLDEAGHTAFAPPRRPWRNRVVTGRRAFAAAAAAACVVGGYGLVRAPWHLWPSLAELQASWRTRTGEQRQLALAANITIQMNTQTSIVDRSTPRSRQIELVSGEAGITTDLDPTHIFVVLAGGGRSMASQAQFNVLHDNSNVCVTCLKGTVQVEHRHGRLTLQPQQQVSYAENTLGPVSVADAKEATAWQSGVLIFRGAPLSEVVREVNRYRPGHIILVNADVAARHVDGLFHIDRIDGIIEQIINLGASVHYLPGGIVLVS